MGELAAAVAPTPRPPAEPPPGGSRGSAAARPHLARRMMQRLTGVTAETRAADAGMSVPLRTSGSEASSAPATASGSHPHAPVRTASVPPPGRNRGQQRNAEGQWRNAEGTAE